MSDAPQLPPPGPDGYQPSPDEGLDRVELTVSGALGTVSARYRFPTPRVWAHAQQPIAGVVDELSKLVGAGPLDELVSGPPAEPTVADRERQPAPLRADGPGAQLVELPAHLDPRSSQ